MRRIGLFEAKQKLSELVQAAGRGEEIGITRRGRLAARLVPPEEHADWNSILAGMDWVRARLRRRGRVSADVKELITTGRQ